jgi:hypothetical protein
MTLNKMSIKDTKLWFMSQSQMSYDIITEYLQNDKSKADLDIIDEELKKWEKVSLMRFNEYKIDSKFIVGLILMYFYGNELGLIENTILMERINEFMRYIDSEYVIDNGKKLISIKLLADEWKKKDWNTSIKTVINIYLEYEKIVNEMVDDNSEKIMYEAFRDEVYKLIKLLSPMRYEEHIRKYRDFINNQNVDKIREIVRKQINNEYWNNVKEEYRTNKEIVLERLDKDFDKLERKMINDKSEYVECDNKNIEDEYSLLWKMTNTIKKYDSPSMDSVYDRILEMREDFIDKVRFLYNRIEIIISLLNKDE